MVHRLVWLGAVFAMLAPAAEGPSIYAIRGAKVVPASGPSIDSATVVVRDGLIEAVGANVAIPADAWVIEGKGLTVYPGFIDALSNWGIPVAVPAVPATATGRAARTPALSTPAPSTTPAAPAVAAPPARGPEDRPSNSSYARAADQLVATEASIALARDSGFTSAVTYPPPKIFSGQGVMFNLAGERVGEMIVASPAAQQLSFPTAGANAFSSFPGSLMGVMAYIHQVFLDAAHYKEARDIYDKHPQGLVRPAYDHTLEGVLESPRILLPAQRAVEIDRMIRFAGTLNVPAVLYGISEGYRAAEQLKQANIPVLVSLKWPARLPDANPSIPDSLRVLEVREQAPSTAAALAKAGVTFAFYSDGVAPRELMRAARKAIDAGLSPEDTVRAFTLNAAKIYGVADRLGSIEKGKIANLVVTEGDIFQERTHIKYVFVDGEKYEPGSSEAPAAPSAPATGGLQ